MKSRIFLNGFTAELPPYCRPQQESFQRLASAHARSAVTASGLEHDFAKWQERITQLLRRYSCSPESIGWRRSEISDFMHTDWAQMKIFNLHEDSRGRGLTERSAFYADTVNRVVDSLFMADSDPPSDLLHVSCTGYTSPSAIQRLIERNRWNGRTQATHVYHMGCYAALPALRIAAGLLSQYLRSGRPKAEVVHTELCTLHFNPGDHSPEQLIVQTLFADGHIRYSVLSGGSDVPKPSDAAFEVLAILEAMVPDSLDDMTWTLSEWGFRMTLSRDIPGKIAASLPKFLKDLFAIAGLRFPEEVDGPIFAIHPGGPRILDSVEETLGLTKPQLQLSRSVLFERGNMSSSTLPHIWMAAAADPAIRNGGLVASLAFGPGLTIAGALFRKC